MGVDALSLIIKTVYRVRSVVSFVFFISSSFRLFGFGLPHQLYKSAGKFATWKSESFLSCQKTLISV